ncbi:SDR family NAD(P)-dependent oxidoreductase [Microbacterium sp. KSW2-21]|uniref:SDR family NAD(P)-dependent oxidoreductase n=1 Tax=Microbacterium algihabitans TaxID=3075992 RepID=A0ABU3S014_9MICO|nr:SDR family NAD(P)-dependent oxidoreductase [Microbacterium sp. KSW2-21]MDU0328457.1 SDR family NAD(P)-dependent oxidoreductase [Microbacterium sp. KSW2-21]
MNQSSTIRPTVLITGAASGLGRVVAEKAVDEGWNIVAIDVDGPALDRLLPEAPGERVHRETADVSDERAFAGALERALTAVGSIEACVNNAGVGAPLIPISELDLTDFDRVMRINARGSFIVLKHVLAHLYERGTGAVVNTGSILGYRGTTAYAAYCASKAAVHALTKVAALEGAAAGIRVNAVAPGLVDTPMNDAFHAAVSPDDPDEAQHTIEEKIPVGRYAEASEVADVVLFLLSEKSRYMTGAIVEVDGGLSTSF